MFQVLSVEPCKMSFLKKIFYELYVLRFICDVMKDKAVSQKRATTLFLGKYKIKELYFQHKV